MLLGAVHWVTKWYSPAGPWSADDAASALIEVATRGFAAKPARTLSSKINKSSRATAASKEEMAS
jgi:hypothetical protein